MVTARPVKVTILGINFSPEPTGIAPYTTSIATGLAERGLDVTVVTGYPHYPYWKPAWRKSPLRSTGHFGGATVRRMKHWIPRKMSWMSRAAMEFTFGLQLLTTRWNRPDVVICVTPPLFATSMAIARVRLTPRRPAVGLLIQDVYSRGITETGAASGVTARAVAAVESWATKRSDEVSVIHPGFAVDLNLDPGKSRVIRNWTHVATPDLNASKAFRAERNWASDEIIVLHAGNMGVKQGLENVIEAATIASARDAHIRFVLLGDGNQRAELERKSAGAAGVEFLPPVPDEDFAAALGAADILLVNERPGVSHMSVPSKLTSYFNAGKPVLAAADPGGFTASEIMSAGAGVCVLPGRPDLLVSEVLRLGTDHDLAKHLGDSGKRYSREVLSSDAGLDRYERWVHDLDADRRTTRAE